MAQLAQIIRSPGPKEQKKQRQRGRVCAGSYLGLFFKTNIKVSWERGFETYPVAPAKFSTETYLMVEASLVICAMSIA